MAGNRKLGLWQPAVHPIDQMPTQMPTQKPTQKPASQPTALHTEGAIKIRPLESDDLSDVVKFCDLNIGKNYYSSPEMKQIFEKSQSNGVMCSFVLWDKEAIVGVRLTYAPGQWTKGKGSGIHPELWSVPAERVGYFQSLFVSDNYQGGGWGRRLSNVSVEALKSLGTQAIVTHSWKESPNNSSQRYLTNMGFKYVATHPLYWKDIDYVCTYDDKPCQCTAEEMILYLA